MTLLTVPGTFACKASTTMKPSSEYSVNHIFDGDLNTCWNSDNGSPQTLTFDFKRQVKITKGVFQFQGGFVGLEIKTESGDSISELQSGSNIHGVKDTNNVQEFSLDQPAGRYFRIIFPSSSDFYGRIIIYSLQLYGDEI